MSGGTLAHEDGEGGCGPCAGRGLALSSQALLRKRRLVRHRLVVVGPQLGHHLDEGQALDLRVEGLWGGESRGGRGVKTSAQRTLLPGVGVADLNP